MGFIVVCASTTYTFKLWCYDFDHKQRVSSTLHDQVMPVGGFEPVGDFETVVDFDSKGYFGSLFTCDSHLYKVWAL